MTLKNPLFKVIDTLTGRDADPEEIALDRHEFASWLTFCAMDGWYIDKWGNLALLDECGCYDMPQDDRFQIVWNKEALIELSMAVLFDELKAKQ